MISQRCRYPLLLCMFVAYGQPGQNQYYAGNENQLVKLGAQRVFKTINYPDWFQYPAIPSPLRQQLVDDYTTREFLLSFDQSANNAPSTKYNEAGQLILDLLGTSTYGAREPNGSIRIAPTQKEINETIKNKLVPQLVKPREGYELDSPSSHETDYDGQNGDQIRLLDKEIAYLARHNNIPTGYTPSADPECLKTVMSIYSGPPMDCSCDPKSSSCPVYWSPGGAAGCRQTEMNYQAAKQKALARCGVRPKP